jgi:hypothetical protein
VSRPPALPLAVGALAALLLAGAGLLAPLEVRHSAPFGFNLTFDARRGIAVRGGQLVANYPDFNRLDLDLRAYNLDADYDLTVHLRPDRPGAPDVRTLALSVPGREIRHDKATFADPFLTLRFPPIEHSAGQRYHVWIESGPRNRDDVVALWSIKSYSRANGAAVLAAFLRDLPGGAGQPLVQGLLVGLLLALVALFGWLIAAVTALAWPPRRASFPVATAAVADDRHRWYNLASPARRSHRRAVTFWGRRPPRAAVPSPRHPVDARQGRD